MSLYSQCCTLKAIEQFSDTVRWFRFDCQLSHRLAVGTWGSYLASLNLRGGFIRWPGVALPFLVWNSWSVWWDCCPLGWLKVRWGGRCRGGVSCQSLLPVSKAPWWMSLGRGEIDRFVSGSLLWMGICVSISIPCSLPQTPALFCSMNIWFWSTIVQMSFTFWE